MIENVSTQLTVFHCFAHCLLPGRAFASLYALLFLEKEAEIGGRDTVCFMHGLSIYEIKRICHRSYLFIISSGNFQHLTNCLNRLKNNTSPKYPAKSVVLFSQLLLIN